MIKSLLARQETRVQSLGVKDPLEKEMATHSSIFAWKIPWTEEPGGQSQTGLSGTNMKTPWVQFGEPEYHTGF